MLTQVGPQNFVDLSLPEFKHLKPWTAPTGKAIAGRPKGLLGRAAPSKPPAAKRPAGPPAGKSLPPVPEFTNIHPSMLSRGANAEEFGELFEWLKLVDAAAGTFTAAQREQRDNVGKRVDMLRMFVWG